MPARRFQKVLAANRGEIAIRIFRACYDLGLNTVAMYSKEDTLSLFRTKADEAYLIGEKNSPLGAYLDIGEIIDLAKRRGVDAIHPGYGFLSENADFVRACEEAGIAFIGPKSDTMARMGDKLAAKQIAIGCGVPIVPGCTEPLRDGDEALEKAVSFGFPVILKAAGGGGGRGMRRCDKPEEVKPAFELVKSEAKKAFGNDDIFIEKFIVEPKHIEVQVLGDQYGNVMHLGERDCSLQRRYQKVVEVAPAWSVPEETREKLRADAVKIAKSVGYVSAGTVEFLVDAYGNHYFIEMNPRIQVEHTVTEMVTGIDLVRAQILIAEGYPLSCPDIGLTRQEDLHINGYAIQCRVTTEDPQNNFAPDNGTHHHVPQRRRLRRAAGRRQRRHRHRHLPLLRFPPGEGHGLGQHLPWRLPPGGPGHRRGPRPGREDQHPLPHQHPAPSHLPPGQVPHQVHRRQSGALRHHGLPGPGHPGPALHRATFRSTIPTPSGHQYDTPRFPEARREITPEMRAQAPAGYPGPRGREAVGPGPEEAPHHRHHHAGRPPEPPLHPDAHPGHGEGRRGHGGHPGGLPSPWRCGAAPPSTPPTVSSTSPPGSGWICCAQKIPNIPFQMLLRGSNLVGYASYPDNLVRAFIQEAARRGIDVFRVFDSLNWVPSMEVAMDEVLKQGKLCEATMCYTGDVSGSQAGQVHPAILRGPRQGAGEAGRPHPLRQGYVRPPEALCRQEADLRSEAGGGPSHPSPHPQHHRQPDRQPTSWRRRPGWTSWTTAMGAALLPHQPALHELPAVTALLGQERDTGFDPRRLQELSDYWADVRLRYESFDNGLKSPVTDIYRYEIPGGQYTNLQPQVESLGLGHRFSEVKEMYKTVNDMLGDLVKVTPSSKMVGDLAIFMVQNDLTPENIVERGEGLSFPDSVVSYFKGMMGQPAWGFPQDLQRVVLKGEEPITCRPGDLLPPVDWDALKAEMRKFYPEKTPIDRSALLSFAMYPKVFEEYITPPEGVRLHHAHGQPCLLQRHGPGRDQQDQH